jgi:hypothetical protein
MKMCSKCSTEKDTSCFSKDSSRLDGLKSYCKACSKAFKDKYRLAHPEKVAEYNNREEVKLRKIEWYRKNSEEISLLRKLKRSDPLVKQGDNSRRNLHRKLKPELANANKAERKARKLQATPSFINREKVKELYKLAKELTIKTGVEHQVDHIVPLRSDIVSGLHWEANLRVITKEENLRKGNRSWPDMP